MGTMITLTNHTPFDDKYYLEGDDAFDVTYHTGKYDAHGKEIIDDKMIGNHKVLVSRTRSLMLNNGQHCEGEGNGFTVFKLYRENNQVRKISFIDKDIEKYIITP